MVGRFLS